MMRAHFTTVFGLVGLCLALSCCDRSDPGSGAPDKPSAADGGFPVTRESGAPEGLEASVPPSPRLAPGIDFMLAVVAADPTWEGRVVDEAGDPVNEAEITWRVADLAVREERNGLDWVHSEGSTRTDAEGCFRVAPGRGLKLEQVRVKKDGFVQLLMGRTGWSSEGAGLETPDKVPLIAVRREFLEASSPVHARARISGAGGKFTLSGAEGRGRGVVETLPPDPDGPDGAAGWKLRMEAALVCSFQSPVGGADRLRAEWSLPSGGDFDQCLLGVRWQDGRLGLIRVTSGPDEALILEGLVSRLGWTRQSPASAAANTPTQGSEVGVPPVVLGDDDSPAVLIEFGRERITLRGGGKLQFSRVGEEERVWSGKVELPRSEAEGTRLALKSANLDLGTLVIPGTSEALLRIEGWLGKGKLEATESDDAEFGWMGSQLENSPHGAFLPSRRFPKRFYRLRFPSRAND